MIARTWPPRADRRREPAGARVRRFAAGRLASAAVLLFALAPLGAGLAMANASGARLPRGDHDAKQVYVDRADHTCAAASQLINDLLAAAYADTARTVPLPAERDRLVVAQVAPVIRAEIVVLRHLPPPPGDEATVGAIYDAMDQALSTVERDPATLQFYGQGTAEDPFSRPAALAGDHGLDVCARGSPDAD